MPVLGQIPTEAHLNATTPAAPSSQQNVIWQASTAYPDPNNPILEVRDVSGYLPDFTGDSGSGGTSGAVPAPGSGDAAAAKFLKADGTWQTPAGTGGGGSGTVTSVGLSAPPEFTVSGSPVTSSGTLTFSKTTEPANQVWAGPTSGTAAVPSFRALTPTDIPALPESQITGLVSDLAAKAPLVSPALTGTPTAPTATSGDNSTKIATTAFVEAAISGLGGGGGTGTFTSETPAGMMNGTNTTFTLSAAPSPAGSLLLFLNGVEQLAGTDYTLSGSTITYAVAPTSTDWHRAWYGTISGGGGGAVESVIGFGIGNGAAGTNIGPMLAAPHAGTVSKCVVVTKASDGAIALTFKIKQNGTDVFSTDPTLTAGTAAGTVRTFTALTSTPLNVAAGDVFSIDVMGGTSSWQFTAQLET